MTWWTCPDCDVDLDIADDYASCWNCFSPLGDTYWKDTDDD